MFRLYEAQPLQCKTCGLRFDEGKRDELREHMDWHFKRNMRGKAKGTAPPSRRWLLSIDAWIKHKADQEADVEKAQGSVFDSLEAADSANSAAEQSAADAELPVRLEGSRRVTKGGSSRAGRRAGQMGAEGWERSAVAIDHTDASRRMPPPTQHRCRSSRHLRT